MNINKPKKNPKEINKILVFFNNYRGLLLSIFLKSKNFEVFNIITKKFLNIDVLKKLKKGKNFKLIKNLDSVSLIKFIKKQNFDIIIAAGFPHLFNKEYLNLSTYGIINLHAGRLPKYRGGSPLSWQIINNEKEIGLSVIKTDSKIDHGPVICKTRFKNLNTHNIFQIQKKANKLFLNLTLKAIKIISKNTKLKKQPFSKSYFKQRKDENSLIDFNKSALKIYNFVRALSYPYKGAFLVYRNKKFRITKCKMSKRSPNIKAGQIFKIKNNNNIFIKCKSESIMVLESKPNLKKIKKMSEYI